ncbi:hypothetical protein DTR72_06535 [Salmonella enterica]|nr:hypothetical protein [Salmonella enterica]HAC6492218.1 hypothetical protein [Salmonella enterica subsp. houtenae serovar 44:z36[z38]:-]EBI8224798.1 hypothetical protein [Salmonella enterica]EBO0185830.1 hypothetical protein [Salmonella enterica]ECO1790913.1 hypothetical protein [Salmonella enterica]
MPDSGVNTLSGLRSTRCYRPDKTLSRRHPASYNRYQDTSSWFIRRINWFGSSSVPRSANSA